MKVLFLTAHLPYPPISGGRRREFELISRLSTSFEIHVCAITKSLAADRMYVDDFRRFCKCVNLFSTDASINNQHQYARYPQQMKKHISEEASAHISNLLETQSFDIVHIEGYYLLQHIPEECGIPILLVEHNVEHLLALQRFKVAAEEEKAYLWSEYIKTRRFEQFMWKRATMCVALTNEDKISMEQLEPNIDVRMVPNGSDHQNNLGDPAALRSNNFEEIIEDNNIIINNDDDNNSHHSLLFVGNFAYEPNVDAALYFSRDIFPVILKRVPDARLFLVGNSPTPEICSLVSNKQIVVTGRVPSLIPYYKHADIVLCPLRIGGGVKVKVLEALGWGKAIVSTSIGAQGIDLSTHRAVAVADNIKNFAEKVIHFLEHPIERQLQEQEALAYAKTLPNWDTVSKAFAQLYGEMTYQTRSPRS
jgi:glycosyltransferase involved in cell wall biosynthesis